MPLDPASTAALGASAILLLMLLAVQLRQRGRGSRRPPRPDEVDTVLGWQPEAARVLTSTETQALEILKRAMPGFIVLAQVPLSRFVRVPTRNSYIEWLQRVGSLNADLLLCDSSSRVLAVIDVRARHEDERSRRRHDRACRVLRAAGVVHQVWHQDTLPSPADARAQLAGFLERRAPAASAGQTQSSHSRPMPFIPVPDMTEVLADGDRAAASADPMEPVPSGFFDDLAFNVATPSPR